LAVANGTAKATAKVPFTIAPGAASSVVIHALPTDPATGLAGARLACLPAAF
jgi:Cu-Zn family superoxide dismutase